MGWGEAIAAICALLLPLLQWYISRAPERKVERTANEIQQGRTDIANSNTSAVSIRLDSVLSQASSDTPRLGDDEDTKRRLAKITGG